MSLPHPLGRRLVCVERVSGSMSVTEMVYPPAVYKGCYTVANCFVPGELQPPGKQLA